MKQCILAFLAACVMTAVPRQAQAATEEAASDNSGHKISLPTKDNCRRIGINYSSKNIEADGAKDGPFAEPWNGFSLYWISGSQILKNNPIFLEWGMKFNANFYTDSTSEGKAEVEAFGYFMNVEVPVNVGYKVNVSDGISVMPYIGLNVKGNLFGEYDVTTTYDGKKVDTYCFDIDFFDKDDMDGSKNTFKRVQLGWQVGAYVDLNKFYVNAQYGADFGEIAKDFTTNAFSVGVGLKF